MDRLQRFWNNINKLSDSGCWEWIGTLRNGYGRIYWIDRVATAHRISWIIHNGEIPTGKFVCHHCDNRKCMNPEHLFLGTFSDNMQDMWNKHRHPIPKGRSSETMQGERNINAKLTRNEVLDIRTLVESGVSQHKIANWFDINFPAIWKIVHYKTWKYV